MLLDLFTTRWISRPNQKPSDHVCFHRQDRNSHRDTVVEQAVLGRGAGHSFALSYLGPVVLSTVDVLEESHFTACSKLAKSTYTS